MGNDVLICGQRRLDLTHTQVMGILNVTPDSFSDGGRFFQREQALNHAIAMVEAGATMIDVGGESTRPGALPVSPQEEIDRVCPVIEEISRRVDVVVSVDTSNPVVMKAAVSAGAGLINDVRGLERPGALDAAVALQVPVCLMHMKGTPQTMQDSPSYRDVVADVKAYLLERAAICEQSGISAKQILIDPGFGFGKTLDHNLALLARLEEFCALDYPVLIGVSRKSMIGQLLDQPVENRLPGSLAAAVLGAVKGASVVRVHDVAETAQAIGLVNGVREYEA